ncbi:MAG: hypothetical protein KJO11_06755, partial [Gemmatimonadetes bacterium]|nr:hypothetical protein [Gemmatimonadota bacterium]
MNSAEAVLMLGASDWVGTLVVGGAVAVGTGVGLLLLFASSFDRRAASLLGAFLLAGASTVLGQLIANLELAYRYRVFEFIPLLHSFALGPLAYLYVRARVAPEQPFSLKVWLHAALPAAHFLMQVWVWT